jgi:SAM-dependent methyltransferase
MKNERQKLIEQWKKDESAFFEGWDFSYLDTRMKVEGPPWDYAKMAKKLVAKSSSLLDIDTGGGEVLSKLAPFPKKSFAVEGYKPNVKVAQKNLAKFGVKVIEADSSKKIPFDDSFFDLILNRHGTINSKEIHRVLKHGGIFYTQQVDCKRNFADLIKAFEGKQKWTFNNLSYRKKEMKKLGFDIIDSAEWRGDIIFKDVGAIVYLLKSTPWTIDNFSVSSHLKHLEKLQKKLEKKGKLVFTLANFMILARKLR